MAGETILLVEDERAVARGLEYGLADAGYDVTYREHVGFHEVPYAISEAALAWFLDAG